MFRWQAPKATKAPSRPDSADQHAWSSAGDRARRHRLVDEGVVGEEGEPGLGLHRPHRVCNEEDVQLRIETAGDREDAIGRREIDDLGVLEDVDAEPKACSCMRGASLERIAF